MKTILITGISGVGKSTLTSELSNKGYRAVDLDSPEWSVWSSDIATPIELGTPVKDDQDWIWDEKKVSVLLKNSMSDLLIVSGTAENMGGFIDAFDLIILLSASKPCLEKRLETRQSNNYGKRTEERLRVLDQKDTIEPLLRKLSDYEVSTEGPLTQTVEKIEAMMAAI